MLLKKRNSNVCKLHEKLLQFRKCLLKSYICMKYMRNINTWNITMNSTDDFFSKTTPPITLFLHTYKSAKPILYWSSFIYKGNQEHKYAFHFIFTHNNMKIINTCTDINTSGFRIHKSDHFKNRITQICKRNT